MTDQPPRDLDTVLSTTRAVRKRLDLERPVPRAVVEECLQLAFQAPNGSNGQDWSWVLVDEPSTKQALAELYRLGMRDHVARDRSGEPPQPASDPRMSASVQYLAEHLAEVPVLCIPTIGSRYGERTTFQQASKWGSILPAVWSFMLALRSRGLGSAWTTIHLYREAEVADLLGIPAGEHTQAGLFPIAYTKGLDFSPADRSRSADRVGWNRFPAR